MRNRLFLIILLCLLLCGKASASFVDYEVCPGKKTIRNKFFNDADVVYLSVNLSPSEYATIFKCHGQEVSCIPPAMKLNKDAEKLTKHAVAALKKSYTELPESINPEAIQSKFKNALQEKLKNFVSKTCKPIKLIELSNSEKNFSKPANAAFIDVRISISEFKNKRYVSITRTDSANVKDASYFGISSIVFPLDAKNSDIAEEIRKFIDEFNLAANERELLSNKKTAP